jgi:hypothetical protein
MIFSGEDSAILFVPPDDFHSPWGIGGQFRQIEVALDFDMQLLPACLRGRSPHQSIQWKKGETRSHRAVALRPTKFRNPKIL